MKNHLDVVVGLARLLVTALALAIGTGLHAAAGSCHVTASVCLDSADRTINGAQVHRDCWDYKDTYECVDPGATNYCAGLQAWPSCNLGSSTCTAKAFDGSCLTETKIYNCGTGFTGSVEGVVALASSYTIAGTSKNTSACSTPAANPACYVMGPDVCVDGPGTKTIDGFSVTQDCWQWTRPYACVTAESEDYCKPLQILGCTQDPTFAECAESGPPNDTCNVQRYAYTCSDNPSVTAPNIVKLTTDYTITRDDKDLSACSDPSTNPSCSYGGDTCVEGPETRTINGLAVYKTCWKWTRSYVCASAAPLDYCAPLSGAGCTQKSRTCAETGPDGNCNYYNTTYTCTNNSGVTGTKIITLDNSYTVVTDALNPAACADPAANPKCTLAEEVCAEGPETRRINGLDVYKACWRYDRRYACTTAGLADYCAPLAATAGCSQVASSCVQYGTGGECIASDRSYRCDNKVGDPLPPNVTFLNNEYTISSDTTLNHCTDLDSNPGCQKSGEVCVDAGGTRNINGLDVTKPCWGWQATYTCSDPAHATSECTGLAANADCTLAKSSCAIDMYTGIPDCGLTTKVYSCQIKPPTTASVTSCYNEPCVGGICRSPEDGPDTDFAQAVTGLELQRQAAGYMDESGRIFRGIANSCEHRVFGLSNCCTSEVAAGQNLSNYAMVAQSASFAFQTVKNYGSAYVWDGLFGVATNAYPEYAQLANGTIGKAYAAEAADWSSFSFYGVTFNVTAFGSAGSFTDFSAYLEFNPYAFAFSVGVEVLSKLAACSQDEQTLSLKRGQRLCTYVGSYKTGKIFRRKFEGYCCYNSRLARIVQEQGREQLGRGYGAPQNPDCSGFTAADLEALDFSTMDLSEFVADVQSRALDTTAALDRLKLRGDQTKASTAPNKNAAIAQYMPVTPGSTGAVDLEPGSVGSTTPGLPAKTSSQLRGCDPPLTVDDKTGACKDASGRYSFPYGGGPMPCAPGLVKDSDVDACVDPTTAQYYPLNSTLAMPCAPGLYLKTPENLCKEPTAP